MAVLGSFSKQSLKSSWRFVGLGQGCSEGQFLFGVSGGILMLRTPSANDNTEVLRLGKLQVHSWFGRRIA